MAINTRATDLPDADDYADAFWSGDYRHAAQLARRIANIVLSPEARIIWLQKAEAAEAKDGE